MEKRTSRFRRRWAEVRAVWDESAFRSQTELSKLYKFVHFCLMVWRSFTRNRCPVRASALAYGSLLALIPMLAVIMSITSTFLKKEGEERIDEFITKIVASLTPPAMLETNAVVAVAITNRNIETLNQPTVSNPVGTASFPATTESPAHSELQGVSDTETNLPPALAENVIRARKDIARRIHDFIQNTRSGALGVTGSIVFIFAAISLLSRIED